MRTLTLVAVLMALNPAEALEARFDQARCLVNQWRILGWALGKTYQGWIKTMIQVSPRLLRAIAAHLRLAVQRVAGDHWKLGRWVVLGVDGSRFDLKRTARLQDSFDQAGKKACRPQAFLTTILHLTTGLPWDARIGWAGASERSHLMKMMRNLPADVLLVADAGFVGYPLWDGLQDSGRHFLVRVGSNVRLLTGLGYGVCQRGDLVYLWPDREARAGRPPLVLRLIRLHNGRRDMCLITNVLDEKELSQQQAEDCYRLRWGIELWFRQLKQTAARRKLASAAPAQATLELAWLVVAMTLLGLTAVNDAVRRGVDPLASSPAAALGALRTLAQRTQLRGGLRTLRCTLGRCFKDTYARKASKVRQRWPHKKHDKPPGLPKITDAIEAQVTAAQELSRKLAVA